MYKILVISFCLVCTACMGATKDDLLVPDTEATILQKKMQSLSLDDAINIAFKRNLDIKIAELKQEIARIDKQIAIGNLLPRIDLFGGLTKNNDALHANLPTSLLGFPQNITVPVLDKTYYAYALNAQVPVFVPSLWFLVGAKQKGERIQSLISNLSKKLISLQVMSQYFYIASLEQEQRIFSADVKSAEELQRQAQISLNTESILPWEYDEAKAFLLSRKLYQEKNLREQEIAKLSLLQSLHLPLDTKIQLSDIDEVNVTIPSLEHCVRLALEQNDTWKIKQESLAIEQDKRNIAISNFLPNIVLGGGVVGFNMDLITESSSLYGSVLGLLSVFNGFKTVNEYRKALRYEKIAELELVKQYYSTIIEVYTAYNNAISAQKLYEVATINEKASNGKIQQKNSEIKHGVIDYKDYYKAIKEFHEAKAFKLQSYFQYRLALGSLAIILGANPVLSNPFEGVSNEK